MAVAQDSCAPVISEPFDDLYHVLENWSEGSSKSVDLSWGVSGLCYTYAKNLFRDVIKEQYPVGLVISDWGGTTVQSWAPVSVVDECYASVRRSSPPRLNDIDSAGVSGLLRTSEDCVFNPNANGALYNSFVAPFSDMEFKAGLWYQGETDSYNAGMYSCLQDGMVAAWRELWGADFAFMYTQLSTWNAGGNGVLAGFRLVQESILDVTAKSAMITAADLGDPYSTQNEIHPRNKTELGRRMSMAASSLMYGKTLPHMGPRIKAVEQTSTSPVTYRVTFTEESCGDGVHLEAAQICPDWSAAVNGGCGEVLLLGGDGSSSKATVSVSGLFSVDITDISSALSAPVAQISYCQGDYPLMTVYNSVGAPLLPFVYTL
jgi:hypothetical protein